MSQISSGLPSSGPGSGTVTSISAGTSITLTPNPITTTGTVALTTTNLTTVDGTVYWDGTLLNTTATGTAGLVLTSNGAGVAPTYQASGIANAVTTLRTQDGNSVTPTLGVINLSGGNNLTTTGTVGPNTATISLSGITQHSVQIGGAANSLTQLANGTTGQILTAQTGIDPIWAAPSASGIVTQLTGNTGIATPTAGNINVKALTTQGTATIVGDNVSTLNLGFTDADFNVVVGTSNFAATHTPAVGVANTGLGVSSLNALTGGSGNVAVGFNAAVSLTTGINNTVLGSNALGSPTTSSTNTALGASALTGLLTGSSNVAVGTGAGSNYAGAESDNIMVGNLGILAENNTIRLGTNPTHTRTFIAGIDGVNIGSTAKVVTMGTAGTADQLGTAAITAGTGIVVTPGANTISIAVSGSVVGQTITGNSGGPLSPTAGNWNILTANSTAKFVGSVSTLTLDFSLSNLILGNNGSAITSGAANDGFGAGVLQSITSGSSNTAMGNASLQNVIGGNQNSAYGASSGTALNTGGNNTLVGFQSGLLLQSGNSNVALGYQSGSAWGAAVSNNIAIGTIASVADSARIRIGTNGTHTTAFIAGIDGVNVGSVAKVITMASDQLGTATITAGAGITVTPGANTITIASIGAGVTWSVITADQTAVVENGYFANKAGTLALALPAASAVGDVIEVTNENTALGVQFTQAAGQQILIGNTNTTLGATGTLTSSAVGDTLKIVCKVANTIWRVTSNNGNWTPA